MTEKFTDHATLLRAVRDTRALGKVDLALMIALILRGDYKNGFKSFPSYALLAEDTSYDRLTIMKSAGRLSEMKWISKTKKVNRPCVFFVNTPMILDLAEKAKKSGGTFSSADTETSPFV